MMRSVSESVVAADEQRAEDARVSDASFVVIWVVASCVLLLGAFHYYPFLADDTLISLRYAWRLNHGMGLTWDDYHPVEGYTNLLWTLTVAALGAVGVGLVTASRSVCTVSSLVCLASLVYAARAGAPASRTRLLPAGGAALLFACSGGVQAWSMGGLEQTQLAALLLVAVTSHVRYHETERAAFLGVSLVAHFLLLFARPDSALFAAGSTLAACWLGSAHSRRTAVPALLAVSASGVLLKCAFSYLYYGEWVPNPALIKLVLTTDRLRSGARYVRDYLETNAVMYASIGGFLAYLARRHALRSEATAYVGLLFVIWSAYVVTVGGDIFPAHRHGVVLSALACLAVALAPRPEFHLARHVARWLVPCALVALGVHGLLQRGSLQNQRAETERWEFQCGEFARALGRAIHVEARGSAREQKEEKPLLAVYAAGCMAYYSHLPAIDMYGLNDWQIARNRPEAAGRGRIGHEFGSSARDADYLLMRNPDLLVHHIGTRNPEPFFAPLAHEGVASAARLLQRFREVTFTYGKEQLAWAYLNRAGRLTEPRAKGSEIRFLPFVLTPTGGGVPSFVLRDKQTAYLLERASDFGDAQLEPGGYRLVVSHGGKGAVDVQCNGPAPDIVQVAADRRIACALRSRDAKRPSEIVGLELTPVSL
jgi:hypothetical protein